MADQPVPVTLPGNYPSADGLTSNQLHGRRCRVCGGEGAPGAPLAPSGHVYTATCHGSAPLGWAVAAHVGGCPSPYKEAE